MSQITILNIDESTVQELKQLAWRHGLPLDQSIKRLLEDAIEEDLGRWKAKKPRLLKPDGIAAVQAA